MKLLKLPWADIWDTFDEWMDENRSLYCKKCGQMERPCPDWGDQQEKIEELVEAHVLRMCKRKRERKRASTQPHT